MFYSVFIGVNLFSHPSYQYHPIRGSTSHFLAIACQPDPITSDMWHQLRTVKLPM